MLVISDTPDAGGLERARRAGIATRVITWNADRALFTSDICDAVDEAGAQAIVLAGFMRILAPEAIRRFPNRIVNIHPALLPAFPGAHAVKESLAYGVKVTGVTVHFVDEQVDHGPIISQETVRVEEDDNEATLHDRIQAIEHRLYPEAVRSLAAGRLQVEGRRVRWI